MDIFVLYIRLFRVGVYWFALYTCSTYDAGAGDFANDVVLFFVFITTVAAANLFDFAFAATSVAAEVVAILLFIFVFVFVFCAFSCKFYYLRCCCGYYFRYCPYIGRKDDDGVRVKSCRPGVLTEVRAETCGN